ncbi:hypothetical protein [Cohnella boryungensis]|uniref:Lipoprotein n=1 Tax=Cohnella boryungensis TaxID=768479 RepID=A0ABV8SG24_9BACL
MKKGFIWCLLLSLVLVVGCSKTEPQESQLTLNDVIQTFKEKGYEVDSSEKPMFQAIGADDGVIFYIENSPVKIYQYPSTKDLDKAKSSNSLLKDWPFNGRFLLETKNEDAIKIFSDLK